MGWPGRLELNYRRAADRTLAHDRHSGPLRVLQSLYPEGPGICHHVLVHPPGGIVGGDVLHVEATLAPHAHALITTPGATRFYRSAGEAARQSVTARVEDGARLEWLPLETICHSAALAENSMRFELAPGGEMMGWDVIALGLPASNDSFDSGHYMQRIELPGVWLERGTIRGDDKRLLDIMTALSFQDLVAQSVNKLVTILQEVEHKLLQLVVVFGPYQKQAAKQEQDKASQMLKQLEATKNTSMDQDLADEILKQFGFN